MRWAFLVCALAFVPAVADAKPAAGTRGLVSSGQPLASEAGLAMLEAGGNAVDAAVATAFALAVVDMHSSGIGGGGMALVKTPKGVVYSNFREVAPASAHRDMFIVDGRADTVAARDGARSAGIPGAVAGYLDLHKRFGKLSRAKVMEPAIKLALHGFIITPHYRDMLGYRLDAMRADPEAARIFLVNGEIPPFGWRLVQKDLAASLMAIAKDGADAFYKGSVAKKLVADMQARGGHITAADLAGYAPREQKPLVGSYRGHAVVTAPLPSSGGTVLLTILNIMENLPAERPWHDVKSVHTTIEAMRYAYADRTLLGDPKFVPDPSPYLTEKTRGARLFALIGEKAKDTKTVQPGTEARFPSDFSTGPQKQPRESAQTTHLSVLDAEGNAVSMTTTVNYVFGAAVVAKGTGILWNDEMDDFAIRPGVANAFGAVGSAANQIEAGKVPLSSMTPTLVFEGPTMESPLRMVVGSPGGPRIPSTVAQVIVNYLDYGADIERAIHMGRVHQQYLPDATFIEPFALDDGTRQELVRRGHVFKDDSPWSNATAIVVDPARGVRSAAADWRGAGRAVAQ